MAGAALERKDDPRMLAFIEAHAREYRRVARDFARRLDRGVLTIAMGRDGTPRGRPRYAALAAMEEGLARAERLDDFRADRRLGRLWDYAIATGAFAVVRRDDDARQLYSLPQRSGPVALTHLALPTDALAFARSALAARGPLALEGEGSVALYALLLEPILGLPPRALFPYAAETARELARGTLLPPEGRETLTRHLDRGHPPGTSVVVVVDQRPGGAATVHLVRHGGW